MRDPIARTPKPRTAIGRTRAATLVVAALLALATWPAAGQDETSPVVPVVVLAEIAADPADGQREFIELWNQGPGALDLAGYVVEDAAGNNFTFGSWTLAEGQRVVIWGGGAATAAGPAWSRATVWNNGGDEATLRDDAGAVVDTLAYGDAGALPAPGTGEALLLDNGTFVIGLPTPGTSPDAEAGDAQVSVQNVAPVVSVLDAPARVRPGAEADLRFKIGDGNGAGDVQTWRVVDRSVEAAAGTGGGEQQVALAAPAADGAWTLHFEATDAGGLTGTASVTVQVRGKALFVQLPQHGALRFPPLAPGAGNIVSEDNFTIHNDGDRPMRPLLDISPFRSDGGDEIPVAGNVRVGHRIVGEATQRWSDYTGPLHALPELAAGGALEIVLEIKDVPDPLPAGDYGTTFTVVPR